MSVVHSPDSGYSKEMAKWESQHTQYGPPGRPYTYQPYPTRMYRCVREKDGSRVFEGHTAHDEHEQRNLESRGFVVGGQVEALAALDRAEFTAAELAAERNFYERRMSAQAQAEAQRANAAAGARHLASVPETPITRRGRKPKAEAAPATV